MKKPAFRITFLLCGVLITLFSCTTDCNYDVKTSAVTEVTATSAKSGGNIKGENENSLLVTCDSYIGERGICWSKKPSPDYYDDHQKKDGSGTGKFATTLSNLTPNTTYYIRAYAFDKDEETIGLFEILYGQTYSFTTKNGIGDIATNTVSSIEVTSAISGGTITDDGGSPIIGRGVCWSTLPNPTTGNTKTINGNGTGTFVSSLTGLTSNTTYYLRAYAVNSVTTFYGSEVSFTTP